MKKIILTLLLMTTFVNAQVKYVDFTINGFVNAENPNQDYIVIDFEGKTQKELYNSFSTYFTTEFISVKDVINSVENETITITALSDKAVEYGKTRVRQKYDLYYNIQFLFKDEKVRINMPNILALYDEGGSDLKIYMERNDMSLYPTIFNVDKTVRSQYSINSLENFFNKEINEVVKLVKSDENKNW